METERQKTGQTIIIKSHREHYNAKAAVAWGDNITLIMIKRR